MRVKLTDSNPVAIPSLVALLFISVVCLPAGAESVDPASGDKTNSVVVDEADRDGDGVPDSLDNCPDHPNPDQANSDGASGIGPKQLISTSVFGARSVFVADLDGDGDMDALSASVLQNEVMWFPNLNGVGSFGSEQVISTSVVDAWSVIAADVDGDGDLDVLSTSDQVVWFENLDGAGGFGPKNAVSEHADRAADLYAADVDGDGDTDVLFASGDDDKIAWYENLDGTGSFGPVRAIATDADGASSVYATDVDGDGDTDVLSASEWDDKIAWYENLSGDGDFGSTRLISYDANRPTSVLAADVDGDGDQDVVSASHDDDTIAWYENLSGAGDFGPQRVIFDRAHGAQSVFAADMDGDGDTDVLSASKWDDQIAMYENLDGNGSFEFGKTISIEANGASSVFAADVDGDRDLDVFSASSLDNKIAWYENRGDVVGDACDNCPLVPNNGQFDEVHPDGVGDVCDDPDEDAVVDRWDNCPDDANTDQTDADEDGSGDVCDACPFDGANDIDGDGHCGNVDNCPSVANPDQADADGDSRGDLCDGCPIDADDDADADGLCAEVDNCPEDFNPDQTDVDDDGTGEACDTCPGIHNPEQMDVDRDGLGAACDNCPYDANDQQSDLDGDDLGDVCDNCPSDSNPDQEDDDGIGNFGLWQLAPGSSYVKSIAASDLDGDGDTDNVSAQGYFYCYCSWDPWWPWCSCYGQSELLWSENRDGQGHFGATRTVFYDEAGWYYPQGGRPLEQPVSVSAADVDGDGDADLVSASVHMTSDCSWYWCEEWVSKTKLEWWENDGLGNFGSRNLITEVDQREHEDVVPLFVADVDDDGDMDVLSAFWDEITWYENKDGAGEFSSPRTISTDAWYTRSVLTADLDGDGDADVLSTSWYETAWYENRSGEGSFTAPQVISVEGANSIHAADLDGDGDMDVLTASSGGIVWHENLNGLASFGEPQPISSERARSVVAADGDGDGDLDVFSDEAAWYENVDGSGTFAPRHKITDNPVQHVIATDVDGDGRIDLFSDRGWFPNGKDWVGDICDNCPDESNNDQVDEVHPNGVGDACDDPDGDSVVDLFDNCPDSENNDQSNLDNDLEGDACDSCPVDPDNDIDVDGVCGDVDTCPLTADPDQLDTDGDGFGDICDSCWNVASADQIDTDGDGLGDVCDPCTDTDGDGFGNPGFPANVCPVDNCPDFQFHDQADSNGDGVGDACTSPEISVSVTPNVIWPPDHRMVTVRAYVVATALSGPPIVKLSSITYDERDNGQGDGETRWDVQNASWGTEDYEFLLRAERSGTGDGRTYTVTYSATTTNGSNVTTTASAIVVVSHDQGLSVHPDPVSIQRVIGDTVTGDGN